MATIYFRPSKAPSFLIDIDTLQVKNDSYIATLSQRQADTIFALHMTDADFTELSNMVYGYIKILDLNWERI